MRIIKSGKIQSNVTEAATEISMFFVFLFAFEFTTLEVHHL